MVHRSSHHWPELTCRRSRAPQVSEKAVPKRRHLCLLCLCAVVALAAGCKRSSASASDSTSGARAASGGTPDFPKPLPGAAAFPEPLGKKLQAAWAARDPSYKPRTAHLKEDGSPKYTNRLFLESSPYLRQHAHNPLNWYPWGDEAFETAKKLHRPVLLSVGYSTCHWCHVMEEESFDNEE